MVQPPQFVPKFEYVPPAPKTGLGKTLDGFGRFMGGLSLGLTVLAMIAIASSVGESLDHESGQSIRLVFSTWWYRSLLFIQGINLILNTWYTYIDSTRQQFLPIMRKGADHYKPLKTVYKANFKDAKPKDAGGLIKSLADALHGRGYRAFYDGTSLYAHRGLIARFGSTVTHLGLITIISGALVESFFKVDGTVIMAEGETVDSYRAVPKDKLKAAKGEMGEEIKLGFSVKLDDFEFTEYPGSGDPNQLGKGTASKFKSTVTFIGPDGQRTHKYVRVNHDVRYGGWKFHQASYQILPPKDSPARYFVNLEEKLPSGEKKLHRFESYLTPGQREVNPIPGYDNRFLSVEEHPSGQSVIWTVASKEGVLARGTKPLFSELAIELKEFYPDATVDKDTGHVSKTGDKLGNPAAFIEISSGNQVAFRDWIFMSGRAPAQAKPSSIDFIIAKVDMPPGQSAGAPASEAGLMGKPDPAALEATATPGEAPTITVALSHDGAATERTYKLKVGQTLPMASGTDPRYDIPGDYALNGFHHIDTMMTFLSISKNPGIPIVWMGAIFASFGPIIAFFISRRRVWATVDWAKKSLIVGAESRYSREDLEAELVETVEAWANSKEVALQPALKLPRPGDPPTISADL